MRFPSAEWVAGLVAALNRQQDLARALAGLGPDLAVVVEAEPPALPRPFAAWGAHREGRIAAWRVLEDEDEILELEPAYVVRAPLRVFAALLAGEDPLRAVTSGRLRVSGDLEAVVRRAPYRYVMDAALAELDTELPGAGGAR